jgi:hypothetical protein
MSDDATGAIGPCCTEDCACAHDVDHLAELLGDPGDAKHVSGSLQKELISAFLRAANKADWYWQADPLLGSLAPNVRGGTILGCLFDLCTNLQYIERANLQTPTWLACAGSHQPSTFGSSTEAASESQDDAVLDAKDATEEPDEPLAGGTDDPSLPLVQDQLVGWLGDLNSVPASEASDFAPKLFYSFLRACPRCSYHWGYIPPVPNKPATGKYCRHISVAGHKPGSGPLGDITSGVIGLLVQAVLKVNAPSFDARYVTKQNHPVDFVISSPARLILVETKASPLVTYPLVAAGSGELEDHSDKNTLDADTPLSLYVPHRNWEIPLGTQGSDGFPFTGLMNQLEDDPVLAIRLVSAWYQLCLAYQVPKTRRRTVVQQLSYLTNGWGDNTDSNKTKPGLGRSDDMKKGTYQMLHFGALFKDACEKRSILVALLANMDPVNMYAEYLEPLQDAVWSVAAPEIENGVVRLPEDRVHRLYDGVVTFNRLHPDAGTVPDLFDFGDFFEKTVITAEALASVAAWAGSSSSSSEQTPS